MTVHVIAVDAGNGVTNAVLAEKKGYKSIYLYNATKVVEQVQVND